MSTSSKKRIDPLERVLNLFILLHRANAPMTREQIVQEMSRGMTPYPESDDAQRQLFASDKNTIVRDLGIPIRQEFGHGDEAGTSRYWITEEDMSIPELDLTEEELAVLSLALASIHLSVPEASEAMMKFEGMFPSRSGYDFYVDVPSIVVQLAGVIPQHRRIDVRLDESVIEMDPLRLVFDKGTWYLIGELPGSNEAVAYRCSRLDEDVVVRNEPSRTNGRDFTDDELRRIVHEAQGDELEATVLLDADGARLPWWDWRVKETEPLQSPEEGLRVTVAVDDLARFRGWLIGFGRHAVIESPNWLREGFVSWLQDVQETVMTSPPGALDVAPPETKGHRPGPRPIGERLQRLLSILPWLRLSGSIPVDTLASMLGVAPHQMMRDLEYASMCGVPPYTHDALFDFSVADAMVIVHSPVELFSTPRRTKHLMTKAVKLTPRQATAVAVALAGLDAVTGDLGIHNEAADSLRTKLDAVTGGLPVQVRLETAPFLADIQRMVDGSRRIRMTYVDASGRISERLIDPQHVFVERGESYVIADDVLSGQENFTFRVDQIIDFDPTDVTFERRQVSFQGWTFRGDIVEAVVLLPPGSEWVLDRVHVRAHRIQSDGSIMLWLTVASEVWLARLLLRCGAPSYILEPEQLRSTVRLHIEDLLERYR